MLGPFVTTVGGTTGINPEKAASLSGGGFSNYFARPSYQSTTVANYLTSIGTKNRGLFKYIPCFNYANYSSRLTDTAYSSSGRAYPDISAQAENFQVVIGGITNGVDGTSCSSPVRVPP